MGIFHPYLLGIKYPSQTYKEGHIGNFVNTTLVGDPVVREALRCQVERESQWTNKSSTVVECNNIFNNLSETNFIPTTENTYVYSTACIIEMPKLKDTAKDIIAHEYLENAIEKGDSLELQGEFSRLLATEANDIGWKSLIFSVPRGVMAFAARLSTNSLATPDNLARWGKIVDPKCKLCETAVATLGHIISGCKQSLERFTLRHDSILSYLHESFTKNIQPNDEIEIYTDLEGCKVNGSTIPPDILVCDSARPDMVIINRKANPVEVTIVELTVPWDSSCEQAYIRKRDRYEFLVQDIKDRGYKCTNQPLEI